MLDFKTGTPLESFLKRGMPEERARVDVALSGAVYSESFEQEVESFSERRIMAFLELFCPDAAALIPYLKRIGEINGMIGVSCFPVKGNELLLLEKTGVAKIPTLLVFNGQGRSLGTYVEHPAVLREKLAALEGKARRDLLRDFREGRCGELIEADLLRILQ